MATNSHQLPCSFDRGLTNYERRKVETLLRMPLAANVCPITNDKYDERVSLKLPHATHPANRFFVGGNRGIPGEDVQGRALTDSFYTSL